MYIETRELFFNSSFYIVFYYKVLYNLCISNKNNERRYNMILRRPYAFLIKNFRLIHILLFILFGYITYKANSVLSFFKDYIKNNGNIVIDVNEYYSFFIFVAVIGIIILSVIIFLLMRYKKKPRLFYVIIILSSIMSSVILLYLFNGIEMMGVTAVSGRQVRFYRDISRINFWLVFATSMPVLIRGLGFDVKKFNFNKDLQELKLEAKDNEEVEIDADLSSDGVVRGARRLLREAKYYYFENKLIINIILGIVGFILILMFPFNTFVINRSLNEGEILQTEKFNIKVEDSFVSERNRTSKNNSYVVVKISVIGKIKKYNLDLDEFVLNGKKNNYVPSMKYYYYFTDIGKGYRNNILNTDNYTEYILVYNIKNEDKNKKLVVNYIGNNRKIKLTPDTLK